jgi:hypothetical protein
MTTLTRQDILPLETYARERAAFRARVMAHRKPRTVPLGEHLTLIFEDRLTVHYQIQEMLRAERIFEESAILAELAVYTPLIPDGDNWKATLLIAYPDPAERAQKLAELVGIETRVWVKIAGQEKIFASADTDLARSDGKKTSAVHFLTFALPAAARHALQAGAALELGVAHPRYTANTAIAGETLRALLADLDTANTGHTDGHTA